MKNFTFLLFLFLGGLSTLGAQVDLPINFEDAGLDYMLTDFGGNISSIEVDPADAGNMVAKVVKQNFAETWAGTTAGGDGLATPINLTVDNTTMTVRVWSPDAGTPILLKIEDAGDPTKSVETITNTTSAMAWETLTFDFNNEAPGTAMLDLSYTFNKVSIFFNFNTSGADAGEKTYYFDDIEFDGEPAMNQVDLPVTFEDDNVDYALTDFGGNLSAIVTDPTDMTNTVCQVTKQDFAELWAGTTVGGSGLASEIPFSDGSTSVTVRVWSPDAGIPVLLKAENTTDGAMSVETSVMTTVAGDWETMEFDFTNNADGTPVIDFGVVYDKLSIFFNFGTTGAVAGEKIYYFDDIEFDGEVVMDQVDLPVTFEDDNVDYALTDFGGNLSSIVTDPTDMTNTVCQATKQDFAELWAGTTVGGSGLATAIPFAAGSTSMTVRVWSPDAGIPILMKVENTTDGAMSVETSVMTTVAGDWETMEFDFTNNADGTPPIDFNVVYDKVSIFFNFGTTGADAGEKTYYFDDLNFVAPPPLDQVDLPITFEDENVDYALGDFGGNASAIVEDPTDGTNTVVMATKQADAQVWAGTTAGVNGLANPIPFAAGATKMTVRVWSPDAGTPILLKAENAADGAMSVETNVMTTVAGDWETMEFDFTNNADGTPPIDFNVVYDKVSIFFNFGTSGADAGEKTYYFDDVNFVAPPPLDQVDLPITFEDSNVDYALVDFGGNASAIVEDPTDGTNTVVMATKQADAQVWAGTTAGGNGLANPIPFAAGATKMSVRVWSPDAGTPILLKAENAADGAMSVETNVMTTVAGDWETMEFDFTNNADGTPPIDFNVVYDKVSIFFNFGTSGADAGEKTYYFDDVQFVTGPELDQVDLPITFEDSNVDYALVDFGNNASMIVEDPADATNTVAQVTKPDNAEVWAGTTAGGNGLANAIAFNVNQTKISVDVWSPDAGIPILLKVEDAADGAISVETSEMTTVAGAWETLEFDFIDHADGTPALDLANVYDKISIFFNFGTSGADAGEKTYFFDNVILLDDVGIYNIGLDEVLFDIMPNPAQNEISLKTEQILENEVNVFIYDMKGELVHLDKMTQSGKIIDTSTLNPGMYVVQIINQEINGIQKLIISGN